MSESESSKIRLSGWMILRRPGDCERADIWFEPDDAGEDDIGDSLWRILLYKCDGIGFQPLEGMHVEITIRKTSPSGGLAADI